MPNKPTSGPVNKRPLPKAKTGCQQRRGWMKLIVTTCSRCCCIVVAQYLVWLIACPPHLALHRATSSCSGSCTAVLLVTASNTASWVFSGRVRDTNSTISRGSLQRNGQRPQRTYLVTTGLSSLTGVPDAQVAVPHMLCLGYTHARPLQLMQTHCVPGTEPPAGAQCTPIMSA